MTDRLEQENKRLQAELDAIKANPGSEFYENLTDAIKNMGKDIKNKKLDLIDDTFQKSIFLLAQNSDKIFNSLDKGLAFIEPDSSKGQTKKSKQVATQATDQIAV